MKHRPLAILALAALLPFPAGAATISFDNTFGPGAIPFGPVSVPLPKFDTTLGTLTSVELTLDASLTGGNIRFDSETPSATTLNELGIGATLTATAPASLIVITQPTASAFAILLGADDEPGLGNADFAGPDFAQVVNEVVNDSNSSTLSSGFSFYEASFVGENFDTDVDAIRRTVVDFTGGSFATDPVDGSTNGLVTVTYTYDPIGVPELSRALLGFAGLGAVGFVRRRPRL